MPDAVAHDHAVPEGWTFLSNHGHVLVALKDSPDARLRELADRVGISERAVQKTVANDPFAFVERRDDRRVERLRPAAPPVLPRQVVVPAAPQALRTLGEGALAHQRQVGDRAVEQAHRLHVAIAALHPAEQAVRLPEERAAEQRARCKLLTSLGRR